LGEEYLYIRAIVKILYSVTDNRSSNVDSSTYQTVVQNGARSIDTRF